MDQFKVIIMIIITIIDMVICIAMIIIVIGMVPNIRSPNFLEYFSQIIHYSAIYSAYYSPQPQIILDAQIKAIPTTTTKAQ